MTRQQEDYLSMSQTTISFLQTNESVWTANAPLTAVITEIDTNNSEIVDWLAKQEASHGGVTAGKHDDRDNTEEDVHTISNILSFFAAVTGNAAVQGAVKASSRDLARLSGLKLVGVAQMVLQTAKDNLAAAGAYGLTQTMIDSLSQHTDAFTASINAPRLAISGSVNATDMIEQSLHTLHTDIEDKLDAGMVLYKSNTEFYNQYKIARTIVHSPTRHIAVTVHFADNSGNAVAGVNVTITNGKEGTIKLLRKSSELGNIRVQNLVAGDYEMKAEKAGFTTQETEFTVAPPATTKLDVVMQGGNLKN